MTVRSLISPIRYTVREGETLAFFAFTGNSQCIAKGCADLAADGLTHVRQLFTH
jgi:hypothetical protein